MNENLLYTKEHEWIKVEGEFAYIGITNYAQGELGDIIFVELPDTNDEFNANDVFGTIEAVKTVADLFMPVSSSIVEINDALEDEPELINSSPEEKGWIVKIKITNKSDLDDLLSYNQYKDLID